MKKNVKIFDTTLRDGEQSPGCSMTISEKVEVAKQLERLNVDIIEAGFAASSEKDFKAIEEISKAVKTPIIASLARCNTDDIDKAYESLRYAKNKRIHVFIATSDIHMKYKLKKTKKEVLETVFKTVSYAKAYIDDIEFSLEDATRTDKDFACQVIRLAIICGATTINIPDTVGYVMPDEFIEFIKYIKDNVKELQNVNLSVHCHNDLGCATANSLAAVRLGANQVECTINGIGERAGNTAMEEVVAVLDSKKSLFGVSTNINKKEIYESSKLVENVTGSIVQRNKPIVGFNAFRHEAGIHQHGILENKMTYEILEASDYGIDIDNIVIGIHSGHHAFINKIESMGYNVSSYNVDDIVKESKEYLSDTEVKSLDNNILKGIIDSNKKAIYQKRNR